MSSVSNETIAQANQQVPVLNGTLMFLQGVGDSYNGNIAVLTAIGGIIKGLANLLQQATDLAYGPNGVITNDNNEIQATNNKINSTSSSNTGQLTKLGDQLNAQQQQLSVDTSKFQNESQKLNAALTGFNQVFSSETASNQSDESTGGQTAQQVQSATQSMIQQLS